MVDGNLAGTPVAAPLAPDEHTYRLHFIGSGSEYFRIWIVNLLLSLCTLGIYSAWAKVRRLRYFYDNTLLDGVSFEYHGRPFAILKGRLIAAALFVVYSASRGGSPLLHLFVAGVFVIAIPWILWKSLRFRLHNSSYRGVRFGFAGALAEAYTAWLLRPALAAVTLYVLWPFAHQRMKAYQHGGAQYGRSRFQFDAAVWDFYRVYLLGAAVAIGAAVLATLLFAGSVITRLGIAGESTAAQSASPTVLLGLALMIGVLLTTVVPLFQALLQRAIWNGTLLDGQRFRSDMRWSTLAWITATNLLGILCTFGLYTPFARVRLLRYQVCTLSLQVAGGLDRFESAGADDEPVIGDALSDVFDVDLTL